MRCVPRALSVFGNVRHRHADQKSVLFAGRRSGERVRSVGKTGTEQSVPERQTLYRTLVQRALVAGNAPVSAFCFRVSAVRVLARPLNRRGVTVFGHVRLGQSDEDRGVRVPRPERMENGAGQPMFRQGKAVRVHVLFHRKLRSHLVHLGMAAGTHTAYKYTRIYVTACNRPKLTQTLGNIL